jgi:hypothetical protein
LSIPKGFCNLVDCEVRVCYNQPDMHRDEHATQN